MAIIINIDVRLAKRKMSVTELADKVGITMPNISVLKIKTRVTLCSAFSVSRQDRSLLLRKSAALLDLRN